MGKQDDQPDARTDFLTPIERKQRMSRIRSKNTKIEMAVRRLVYGLGFRYRLHSKKLPGHPDMVFAGRRKVIFVHGCFWHLHEDCRHYRLPKANREFWMPKLEETRLRDIRNLSELHSIGWNALVVWECELKDKASLAERVRVFLKETG